MDRTSLSSEWLIEEVVDFGNDTGIQIISSLIDNPEPIHSHNSSGSDLDLGSDIDVDDEFKNKVKASK